MTRVRYRRGNFKCLLSKCVLGAGWWAPVALALPVSMLPVPGYGVLGGGGGTVIAGNMDEFSGCRIPRGIVASDESPL